MGFAPMRVHARPGRARARAPTRARLQALLVIATATAALAAMDAECAQLLVQVRAFDAERLRGARDVPLELGEPDADELRLDLLAELAERLAGVAAEIDRGDGAGLVARAAGRARSAEVRRQILFAD